LCDEAPDVSRENAADVLRTKLVDNLQEELVNGFRVKLDDVLRDEAADFLRDLALVLVLGRRPSILLDALLNTQPNVSIAELPDVLRDEAAKLVFAFFAGAYPVGPGSAWPKCFWQQQCSQPCGSQLLACAFFRAASVVAGVLLMDSLAFFVAKDFFSTARFCGTNFLTRPVVALAPATGARFFFVFAFWTACLTFSAASFLALSASNLTRALVGLVGAKTSSLSRA
jgi:hypothetical protein